MHLIRNANKYVAYGDLTAVSAALRQVYTAVNDTQARQALDAFAESELGKKYPQSVLVWERAWDRFVSFLQFTPQVRKMVYTTNAIESLNSELRKATRNRIQFPNDQAAVKALWLTICNIEDKRAKKPKGAPKAKGGRPHDRRSNNHRLDGSTQPNDRRLPGPIHPIHLENKPPHTNNLTRPRFLPAKPHAHTVHAGAPGCHLNLPQLLLPPHRTGQERPDRKRPATVLFRNVHHCRSTGLMIALTKNQLFPKQA